MLSLYVHLPFCVKKCPYCDFISYDDRAFYTEDYIEALSSELAYYKNKYKPVYETLFIGGGTPTCLSNKQLDALFTVIYRYADRNKLKEITIEANPETLTEEKAKILKSNVTRISIGAQSFNNGFLKKLGRIHTVEKTLKALEIIKNEGFENISIDLMFGIPGQKTQDVIYDIKAAAKTGPRHISFYMLTPYEGTEFAAKKGEMPGDEASGEMYASGISELEKKGYMQYEISNFAKDNKISVHNMNYWNGGGYIGIGVSAASYFDSVRYKNTGSIEEYIKILKKNNDPAVEREKETEEKRLREHIMLGLRKREGINKENFKNIFKFDFTEKYSNILGKMVSGGYMEDTGGNVRLTVKGMLVSNRVISEFF